MDQRVRGYLLASCNRYLTAKLSADERECVLEGLPAHVPREAESFDDIAWYPVEYINAYHDGIARLYGSDDDLVYAHLFETGRCAAESATSGYMRPLLRLMTPAVFAQKVPDLWMRDNRFGRLEADVSDLASRHLVFRLTGVACYLHAAPIAAGFASFALSAIGLTKVEVAQQGWSLATPSPDEVLFDVSWRRKEERVSEPALDVIPIRHALGR